jgi:hypothetical protein
MQRGALHAAMLVFKQKIRCIASLHDPLGLDSSQPLTSLHNQPDERIDSFNCTGKLPFLIKA